MAGGWDFTIPESVAMYVSVSRRISTNGSRRSAIQQTRELTRGGRIALPHGPDVQSVHHERAHPDGIVVHVDSASRAGDTDELATCRRGPDPPGTASLYMAQSRKGQTRFLQCRLRTGTAWSTMIRRMAIETRTLYRRMLVATPGRLVGAIGLSWECDVVRREYWPVRVASAIGTGEARPARRLSRPERRPPASRASPGRDPPF